MSGLASKLKKFLQSPRQYAWVLESALARVRGEAYRQGYRLLSGGRVSIGRGFVAECALRISGPGRVTIGQRCRIRRSNLQDVAIVTLAPEAVVDFGDDSTLGGMRVRCADHVRAGKKLLAAKTTLTDTDFGGAGRAGVGRGIDIGEDCWLGVDTAVLGGVRLGNNVVVSGGSVVLRDMPDDSMAMGNPARPVRLAVGGKT